jgi:YcaO-like protein with predicted kinase domain
MQAAQLFDRLQDEAVLLRRRGAVEPNSDRLDRAADTVARMRARFDRFGITRLAEVTGLDRIGIPVWMAVRPNARTLAVSQGKGLTDCAAQASAVMEAAELAVAEQFAAPIRLCTASELLREGFQVMPLRSLLKGGAECPKDDTVLPWVLGFDLLKRCAVWVPADTVSLDGDSSLVGGTSRYWRSSDGLASGNLLLEAVVHALCERIERDANVLWLLNSDREVGDHCIDPAALQDRSVSDLAERVFDAGLQLRLFDITSNIGVPVFFATIAPPIDGRERHWKHFDLCSGSGCHPSPIRAAMRAITEAAQSRVTSIAGARDDFDPNLYGARLKSDLLAYSTASPRRKPAPPDKECHFADILSNLLASLAAVGIHSVVVVPLDAASEGFAVAKVLVPELEHLAGDRRQRFGTRALTAMVAAQ